MHFNSFAKFCARESLPAPVLQLKSLTPFSEENRGWQIFKPEGI